MNLSKNPRRVSAACLAANLLAACGAASAAPFQVHSYQAGGGPPGIGGAGFAVSSGGFFVADGAGSNVGPASAASFTAFNEYEFDSHFALDTFGPSARNRSSSTGNNSTMTLNFYGDYGPPGGPNEDYNEGETIPGYALIVGPGSHIGDPAGDGSIPENLARADIGVAPPPVFSGFAPNASGGRSAFDGVFIGRFTVSRGAALSGGILLNVMCGTCPGGIFSDNLDLGGPAVLFDTNNGPQLLALRAYRINRCDAVDLQNPSAATAAGVNFGTPFGLADVYDLWVQVVATGAMSCERIFTTELAFEDDTTVLLTEGFEGETAANSRSSVPITTVGGVTITPSTACPMRTAIGVYNTPTAGATSADGSNYLLVVADPGSVSCPSGNSSTLTIDLPIPVTAFGVHISDWGDFGSSGTLALATNTGASHQVAMTPPALADGNAIFIGVTAAQCPFSQVVLTSTAIGESFGIDKIRFGEAICHGLQAAVPPPECPGDANGDGMVAFSDITSVLENWNADYSPGTGPGDANHNGIVNFADITSVLENWGSACR